MKVPITSDETENPPGGRIKLAYLSADFREHPMSYLIVELFELHDRNKFEVHALSIGPVIESSIRSRVEKSFDYWHEVSSTSDQDVIDLIASLGIDIVIDLMGHTSGGRSGILERRPAPVQVSYLGFPGTSGAYYIDYVLVDRFIAPADHDQFYSEKLVRLPHSYMVHDSQQKIADTIPSRASCHLPEDSFVFCCFNKSYKITPDVFDIWMRLLSNTPDSILWLLERNTTTQGNLRQEAERRGINTDRLIFAPFLENSEHLARHRQANLFLDTFYYNAHTTAIDALWTGLPVLTCAGGSFASRVAGSLLHAIGLPELITDSPSEYEAFALKLAHEPLLLEEFKNRLATNRSTKPLFDSKRLALNFESAYTRMHQTRLAGKTPEAFSVSDTYPPHCADEK